jgi:DNA mismatch endonuclease (patch repair protein)
MAAIRGKNTRLEMTVRRGLHARGLRYSLHGCFWHAHEGCTAFRLPKTRPDEWAAKLFGNRRRDARVKDGLETLGWRVLVVWECEIRGKTPDQVSALLESLANRIKAGQAQ